MKRLSVGLVFAIIAVLVLGVVPVPLQVEAQAPETGEIIEQRDRTSKVYYLGDNKYSLDVSSGSIHYQDEYGDWQEIDNSWQVAAPPWDWEMTEDAYHTQVIEDFTAGQILLFRSQGEFVAFQPMALEWTNDLDQISQVSMPQDVAADVRNQRIELLPNMVGGIGQMSWDNAYGSGRHFQWNNTPGRLDKLLILDSEPASPPQYIIDGGNAVLRLNFIFDPSPDLDIYVGDALWNQNSRTQSVNTIEFRKDGETLWGFLPANYWGSGNTTDGVGITELDKAGNSLYVSIKTPYAWLNNATYPVYIDPSLSLNVTQNSDDARESESTGEIFDDLSVWCRSAVLIGTRQWGAFRWVSGALPPQGSVITNCTVEAFAWIAIEDSINGNWHFQNSTSPATFNVADAFNITDRPRTTASVSHTENNTGQIWVETPELTTVLQEVVDSYSPTALALIFRPNQDETLSMKFKGNDATKRGRLHIEWTVGGATPPTVATDSATGVTNTTGLLHGNVTAVNDSNILERGFVWDTQTRAKPDEDTAPNASAYAFFWTEVGNWTTGAFNHTATNLTPATTYFFRSAARNDDNKWGYGNETTFLTLPDPPTNVVASDGTSTAHVTITWTKSSGNITGYHILYGASTWLVTVGDVVAYNDTSAPAPTITPGLGSATDGTSTTEVTLTLAGESANVGASRTYFLRAYNGAGNSTNSGSDAGYRGVGALTYQWMRSAGDADAGYGNIAGATTDPYSDTAAPAPTITGGNATASDATSATWVTLTAVNETANNGAGRYFKCTLNATGAATQNSTSNRGYRGTTTLTYQWMESLADVDANYSNIAGATTDPFNHMGGVFAPDGRYYMATINMTGAVSQNTSSDRGNKLAANLSIVISLNATNIGCNSATLNGNITSVGASNVTVRGFDYGLGSGNYTLATNETGTFSAGTYALNISSLSANTTYYVRAFAVNIDGTGYGNETSFLTLPATLPIVTSSNATGVGFNVATLHGNITSTGCATVTLRGFEWGTNSGNYTSNWTEAGSFGVGVFQRTVATLVGNTSYFWRALALNSVGANYSIERSFNTTTGAIPLAPTNFTITQTGADSANITWVLGLYATLTIIRGSENGYPASVTDGYLVYNGTGTFVELDGLNLESSTYYYMAWSWNSLGYSVDYAQAQIGGNMIAFGIFLAMGLVLTMGFFWKRNGLFAYGAAGAWALLGLQAFQTSASTNPTLITDTWMGLFWLCIAFVVGCALLPTVMREKPEKEDLSVEDAVGDEVSAFLEKPEPQKPGLINRLRPTRFNIKGE